MKRRSFFTHVAAVSSALAAYCLPAAKSQAAVQLATDKPMDDEIESLARSLLRWSDQNRQHLETVAYAMPLLSATDNFYLSSCFTPEADLAISDPPSLGCLCDKFGWLQQDELAKLAAHMWKYRCPSSIQIEEDDEKIVDLSVCGIAGERPKQSICRLMTQRFVYDYHEKRVLDGCRGDKQIALIICSSIESLATAAEEEQTRANDIYGVPLKFLSQPMQAFTKPEAYQQVFMFYAAMSHGYA